MLRSTRLRPVSPLVEHRFVQATSEAGLDRVTYRPCAVDFEMGGRAVHGQLVTRT